MTEAPKPSTDVLRKIRKLLRLAKSNNPNEAANALAQAQRLMDEHRVEMSTLDVAEEERPSHDLNPIDGRVRGKTPAWRKYLAEALAIHNGCKTMLRGGQIEVVGRPSDVVVLRYMYAYVIRQLQRLAKRDAVPLGREYTASYRMGACIAIHDKLEWDRRWQAAMSNTSGSTALAIVDRRYGDARRLVDLLTGGRTDNVHRVNHSDPAIRHGYAVGATEIELNRALNTGVTPDERRLRAGGAA